MVRLRGMPLIVRADADASIGTGHFMRGVALGQAWADSGGAVLFVTATNSEPLIALAEHEGFDVWRLPAAYPADGDLDSAARTARTYAAAWIAVDGLRFDAAYCNRIRANGSSVLVIDDTASWPRYDVEAVLNQNAHARRLRYVVGPRTRLYLGTRYVLLRREFRVSGRRRRVPAVASRVLVTLGGADPRNMTAKVVRALGKVPARGLEATVVIGPANPHRSEIEGFARKTPMPVRLVDHARDMAVLMRDADLAVVSGGTTVWELAYMGVPALVVETAASEGLLIAGLEREGLFRRLGAAGEMTIEKIAVALHRALEDSEWRRLMAARGRQLVDGRGGMRIVNALAGEGGSGAQP